MSRQSIQNACGQKTKNSRSNKIVDKQKRHIQKGDIGPSDFHMSHIPIRTDSFQTQHPQILYEHVLYK